MPSRQEVSFVVDGLEDSVEILVDQHGVPHIYASGRDDLFLAQGFNAARDRSFQIDLWRRRGLGLLSEVFGDAFLDRDRAARLFVYRGDMRSEWLAYGSGAKRIVSAFVRGINSFVALCHRDPSHLAPEFSELGYLPSFWQPEDVPRIRSHGLFSNLEQEVARALTLRDFGAGVEDLRRMREPAVDITVPDGLDLSIVPDDVLEVYRLATTPPPLADPGAPVLPRRGPEGSNNWVISGARTASGRPLLANDPHRAVSLPSLRYIAHLSAPGIDVIGAGEPALPGVSIGHNGQVAFGLTIFPIDQEDLYVYETNPDDATEYRYDGRWEAKLRVVETFPTPGGGTTDIELRFTRHGPVIREEAASNTAFAVRAAWLEPGMAPYLGSIDYMRAATPEQFVTAMDRWGAPGENQVYASPDGSIGWRPGGLVPVRPNCNGTLPVPGDGRYEWDGFYDGDQLPSLRNPSVGWCATANEMNLPPDYPNHERTITYDWYHRFRRDRIEEVLSARDDWTVHDCVALQNDYLSVPARCILPLLAGLTSPDPDVRAAVELLGSWDAVEDADSPAAALFEVWYRRHLRPAVLAAALRQLLPEERCEEALDRIRPDEDVATDARVDLQLLLSPHGRLGSDPEATRAGLLLSSLRSAVTDLTTRLGDDPGTWSWGRLHRAEPKHPLHDMLPGREWTSVGPLPRGGSGDTVGSTGFTCDFTQSTGATFRIVVDVGNWDGSVAMNSPGQSGVPGSQHFADLFEPWADDGSFPLVYSREAVEEATVTRIVLQPS